MKLSIITINYNNALGLHNTIESVVSQTSHDFEYIVIDGGSSDDSLEVIKRFTSGITYWISETDRGIYHAMNKGINNAKGVYCQFLNSGDTLAESDVIERVLPNLLGASIYVGFLIKIFPTGKIYLDKGIQGDITMLSLYRGVINHSSSFIKRDLFDKYGLYDESLKIVSDWKWYFLVVGFQNEVVVKLNLIISRFYLNGISYTNIDLLKKERRKVLEEFLPSKVLSDYDSQWRNIDQATRINRYWVTRWLFWFVERVLFKWEKLIQKLLIKQNDT